MTHHAPVRQALASNISRRGFFGLSALAGVAAAGVATAQSAQATTSLVADTPFWAATGSDLNGWVTDLGDALYTAPGQAAVTMADIETINSGSLSTLRANIKRRGIMAHNIAYKRIIDATLFDSVHTCSYQFRLPYLPKKSIWPDNAQTVEGGFFIWDGGNTRLDYGMAFQWVLNPWQSNFGVLQTWTGSSWQAAGYLAPGTEWNTVDMTFDRRNNLATLNVNGTALATQLTTTTKTGWGTGTAARLQTEIVSLYPGNNQVAPSHRAEMRNWSWTRSAYI